MSAKKGYSKEVQINASALSSLLAEKLRGKAVYGLVWRLEEIAWLKGKGEKVSLFPLGAKEEGSPIGAMDLVGQWPQGRLFDGRSELRWRKGEGEVYDLLSLAEAEGELADVGEEIESATWEVVEPGTEEPASLLLAGSIKDEEHEKAWIETRFPHSLLYPVGEKGDKHPPSVHYYEYRDEGSGTVQFLRFLEVK